jgi:cytochrome c oxidase subunit 2
MLAQIQLIPEQASTIAPRVDALFLYLTVVTVVFTTLIAVLIITFAIRYRRRPANEVPKPTKDIEGLEILWSVVPLLLCLVMFFWGANIYFAMARPPDNALEIYVVARQWMWKLQHPEGQREINTLHIPVDVPVKLLMTSEDVIHSFFVPAFRTKQDVVPGRYTTTWFQPTRAGTYHLFCAEYCGTEHSKMIGKVIVMEQADYQDWLASSADGSMALEGRKLFTKLQCITCHNTSAEARAPNLEGTYNKRVVLTDGQVVRADENYIRESILQPAAKVVAGYRPIMPTYQDQISEEELVRVIAFLKALQPGQMLPRVEDTPPPVPTEPLSKQNGKP